LARNAKTGILGGLWFLGSLVLGSLVLPGCMGRNAREHQAENRQDGFSFAVFGDNRWDSWPAPVPKALEAIIDDINRLKPDFAVETGDFVLGASSQQFSQYLGAIKKLVVPMHFVMGNHDANILLWKKMIDRRLFYSFDHKGCHFVVLNCYLPGYEGRIAGYQLEWLSKDLEAHQGAKHTFVFLHEPLYPVGPYKGGAIDRFPEDRDRLANLLRKHNAAVFCSHAHHFNQQVVDGLTHIITGGAGAPLHAAPKDGGFYHYIHVRAEAGRVSYAVIPVSGEAREAVPPVLGHWKLDGGQGNWIKDSSPNGNHGAIFKSQWVKGKVGSALMLDGQDDCVSVQQQINATKGLTLGCWAKPASIKPGGNVVLCVGREQRLLILRPHALIWEYVGKGGQRHTASVRSAITIGEWHHVAVTHDFLAKEIVFYVNGKRSEALAAAEEARPLESQSVTLGGLGSRLGRRFHGTLDEVKILDTAVSGEEVRKDVGQGIESRE